MTAYVNFKGQCEAAFKFYERCFGAELGPIFHYGGSPMADQVPSDGQDKVMHGSVTVGGQVLMAPTSRRNSTKLRRDHALAEHERRVRRRTDLHLTPAAPTSARRWRRRRRRGI